MARGHQAGDRERFQRDQDVARLGLQQQQVQLQALGLMLNDDYRHRALSLQHRNKGGHGLRVPVPKPEINHGLRNPGAVIPGKAERERLEVATGLRQPEGYGLVSASATPVQSQVQEPAQVATMKYLRESGMSAEDASNAVMKKPGDPSKLSRLIRERDSFPEDHHARPIYDAYIAKLSGQGGGPEVLDLNESEAKAAGFHMRMISAQKELDSLGEYDPKKGFEALMGKTNLTASPEYQRYQQAAEDWIRAKLRKESGAVIGEEEMAKEFEVYFPQLGDSPEVLAQKARARRVAEQGMLLGAGGYQKRYLAQSSARDPAKQESKNTAPPGAIEYLKQNPGAATEFEEKYGYIPEGI
jgi:hypothetical protein